MGFPFISTTLELIFPRLYLIISVIICRHRDNGSSNMSKQEIFQMKQTKADELNDYAVRSAYPAISYTVKKPPVEITEIVNRKKIMDLRGYVKTENTERIRGNNEEKEKKEGEEKSRARNVISSSIKSSNNNDQNDNNSKNNGHSQNQVQNQNQNRNNYKDENGIIIIDIAIDSDSSVEIIGKEKLIEQIDFSDDDFDKSSLSQGPRTKIPRSKEGKCTGTECKEEGEGEGREGGGGDGIELEKRKEEEREKRKAEEKDQREKRERRKESVKEVEKEEEAYSSRIIMIEDPPHLLQRLFNSERGSGYGGGDNKNSINYR
jgi:hypothetical protein